MNSLIANYASSSDSDSSDCSDSNAKLNKSDTENQNKEDFSKPKLPTPTFEQDVKSSLHNSVFKNPFSEAESSKEAVLQKHVKMVENKDNIITINGKKICWNYRKGRCRFGHNCKFAHDSDIELTQEQLNNKFTVNASNTIISSPIDQPHHISNQMKEEDLDSPVKKKSKRPGLTQGLVPGKKVMKQYLNNQKKGF